MIPYANIYLGRDNFCGIIDYHLGLSYSVILNPSENIFVAQFYLSTKIHNKTISSLNAFHCVDIMRIILKYHNAHSIAILSGLFILT